MEANFIEWILQQAGPTAIAAMALYFLNTVWKARCDETKHYADQIQEVWERNCDALNRNTEALTRLLERIDK